MARHTTTRVSRDTDRDLARKGNKRHTTRAASKRDWRADLDLAITTDRARFTSEF